LSRRPSVSPAARAAQASGACVGSGFQPATRPEGSGDLGQFTPPHLIFRRRERDRETIDAVALPRVCRTIWEHMP